MQEMLPLQGSRMTIGGKKHLAVVGPENVATLQKTALGAEAELPKPKVPAVSIKLYALLRVGFTRSMQTNHRTL